VKVATVVGARPQFIKAAAVSHVLRRTPEVREVLVHTGQHYDYEMSRVFFDELEIPEPDHNLGVGSGSHGEQTGRMLEAIERVLLAERPDMVLVYGDTNSTLAGALAAAKLHIPVAHVEAGLRSFNRRMPEEVNRVLTDHASDLLFAPTETAVQNLRREGVTEGVHLVGDVMHDVLTENLPRAASSQVLDRLKLRAGDYIVATVHRAENVDHGERLQGVVSALDAVSRRFLPVVLPAHPRLRGRLREFSLRPRHVTITAPLSYLDMLWLQKNAALILTDSGGVQKEACWLGVPCVTLRAETEWPETVQGGWNVLAGSDPDAVLAAAERQLSGDVRRHAVLEQPPGGAAPLIAGIIASFG